MPTNNTFIISSDYLKNNSVINKNTDDDILEPLILQAQNIYIETACGSDLFNDVISKIQAGTVSGLTKTLIDSYIQPALVQWSVYEAMPFVNYRLTNKTIARKESENSLSAELNEVIYLRDNVKNTAEYMSQRLIQFMKEEFSEGNLPLYKDGNDNIDDIRPVNSLYDTGLYLPDSKKCNHNFNTNCDCDY